MGSQTVTVACSKLFSLLYEVYIDKDFSFLPAMVLGCTSVTGRQCAVGRHRVFLSLPRSSGALSYTHFWFQWTESPTRWQTHVLGYTQKPNSYKTKNIFLTSLWVNEFRYPGSTLQQKLPTLLSKASITGERQSSFLLGGGGGGYSTGGATHNEICVPLVGGRVVRFSLCHVAIKIDCGFALPVYSSIWV